MKSSYEIVSDLPRYQGDICRETALPANGIFETKAFRISNRDAGIELVIALLTALSLKQGQKIEIECSGAKSRNGPFRERLMKRFISGPETAYPGEELARFVSFPQDLNWWKLKITSNADLDSALVTVYLVRKG